MIRCSNCGNFCNDDNIYCNICGNVLQNNNVQMQRIPTGNNHSVNQTKKHNSYATIALVMGIVSIATVLSVVVPLVTGIMAIIFAALSWSIIKKTNGSKTEKHYTLAGFITGIAGILISIAEICFAVQIFMNAANDFIDGLRRAG